MGGGVMAGGGRVSAVFDGGGLYVTNDGEGVNVVSCSEV
jgi:hypothetical protein